MKSNMGKFDRIIRATTAFVIAFGSIYFGRVLVIPSVFILLTAIIGWCPIYAAFRLSTAKEQKEMPPDTSGEHKPYRGPKRLLK